MLQVPLQGYPLMITDSETFEVRKAPPKAWLPSPEATHWWATTLVWSPKRMSIEPEVEQVLRSRLLRSTSAPLDAECGSTMMVHEPRSELKPGLASKLPALA